MSVAVKPPYLTERSGVRKPVVTPLRIVPCPDQDVIGRPANDRAISTDRRAVRTDDDVGHARVAAHAAPSISQVQQDHV